MFRVRARRNPRRKQLERKTTGKECRSESGRRGPENTWPTWRKNSIDFLSVRTGQ
jgi:hypothetical protein